MDLNLDALFRQAFGVGFTLPSPPSRGQVLDALGVNQYQVTGTPDANEQAAKKTWLGTPWMLPVAFAGGNYKRYNYKGEVENARLAKQYFPPATLADFSQDKILTETELRAGAGSVVEMYGFGAWDIRIRGLALNEGKDGLQAQDYKNMLLSYNQVIEPVEVEGAEFAEKDITHIIIRSVRFRRLEGRPYVIPFEIDARSHDALELDYS